MSVLLNVWEVVSNNKIWLKANLTWQDVDDMPEYPRRTDLYYGILIAVVLSAIRFALERFIFLPVTHTFNVFHQKSKNPENPGLEKAFKQKTIDQKQMLLLSQELNWTVAKLESWLRKKKNSVTKKKKFTETAWRLLFYVFSTICGIFVVWGKPCVEDIAACFPPSVKDEVTTNGLRVFYLTELGFYLSLCASMLYDTRRKDFNIMMAHHTFTICLIFIGWTTNSTTMGALIMVCHDVADVPLEGAKLCSYLKQVLLSQVLFVVFVIVWSVSRLVYFPFLVHGLIMNSAGYYSPFLYYLISGLLVALFWLHLLWSWMILRIIVMMFRKEKAKDVRSDDEMESADEEDAKTK